MSKLKPLWKNAPGATDLKGALSFLSLVDSHADAKRIIRSLSRAPTFRAMAKDVLRASKLPLLPRRESQVEDDLKRIRKGKLLSPVLLVRGDMSRALPLVVADGYHRVCAICYLDEDAAVACRIATLHR